MREVPFAHFRDVNKRVENREIVLFGAGNISEKTARKLKKFSFIADNNPNFWNTKQDGKDVLNPELLKENRERYFVIICTTSFIEVSEQLIESGFIGEKDFVVSPILNDLRIISELENYSTKLLFTSGLPEKEDPESGGGIYELTLNGHNWSYKKVYSGICYGLLEYNGNYISVDDKKGVIELDKEYNIVRIKELPLATRGHGITYSEVDNSFYVVASYRDVILILDKEFNQTGEIVISNKKQKEGKPAHHANDICVVGNSIYVTMFSISGNWKKDVFDGAILEIDIDNHSKRNVLINNLWMPHNISFLDGSLTVLDSLRGELKKNNLQPVGKFSAFTRGLDFDGILYFVGQSRNRNFSKNMGLSLNISIDTAIVMFDEVTKVSRTIHLPQKLSEIHDILILDKKL
jgi:hypothetical protein